MSILVFNYMGMDIKQFRDGLEKCVGREDSSFNFIEYPDQLFINFYLVPKDSTDRVLRENNRMLVVVEFKGGKAKTKMVTSAIGNNFRTRNSSPETSLKFLINHFNTLEKK